MEFLLFLVGVVVFWGMVMATVFGLSFLAEQHVDWVMRKPQPDKLRWWEED